MNLLPEIVFWFCLSVILYVYVGYALLLALILPFVRRRTVDAEITPTVSLLISAYNEEDIIGRKIENALSLDYPKNKLEVIVVSDCSTDDTDKITQGYVEKGVKLVRQEERRGKSSGLNLAADAAKGQILVFSDANALYERGAIRRLVRHFGDDRVGYVTGESRYTQTFNNASENSESLYWRNEVFLKKMESRICSVVGGDGAIYAIRKELFEPLRPSDINDFVNPLQIVVKGYRGEYEPEAVCYEKTADSLDKEFRRKKRIVNRSWNGLMRVAKVLNPSHVGFFSIQIISHKLLRWLIPFFLVGLLLSNLLMVSRSEPPLFLVTFVIQIGFYTLAFIGRLRPEKSSFIFYVPYYFCLVNTASLIGILHYFAGNVATVWSPERGKTAQRTARCRRIGPPGSAFKSMLLCLAVAGLAYWATDKGTIDAPKLIFWIAFALIAYTYWVYPILLTVITLVSRKTVNHNHVEPTVTLVIPAYNEASDMDRKLRNALSLSYPCEKLDIVVGSDGSTDATNEIVRRYAEKGIQLREFERRRGKVSVINDVVLEARSEIVLFSDANVLYHPNAIRKIVRNFHDETVGAVSGDARFVNDTTTLKMAVKLYYRYERFLQQKETEFHSMIGADGAIFAIRRALFEPLPEQTILDDFVIPMQISNKGYRVVYEKEAKAYEAAPASMREEFHRKIRLIAGAVQAFKRNLGQPARTQYKLSFSYYSHKVIRWLVPVLLSMMFLSSLTLLDSVLYRVFVCIQVGIALMAVAGIWFQNKLFSVPSYLVLNNAAMLIGLFKGLFDKQPVMWTRFERRKVDLPECLIAETLGDFAQKQTG